MTDPQPQRTPPSVIGTPADGDNTTFMVDAEGAVFLKSGPAGMVSRVAISSAQLLDIVASPVEIVPAPGAGKIAVILGIISKFTFVTTAYSTVTSTTRLYYGDPSRGDTANIGTGFFSSLLTSTISVSGIDFADNNILDTTLENSSIVLSNTNTDPTLGDGTLTISVAYIILPT
jgi:hypothetical protein